MKAVDFNKIKEFLSNDKYAELSDIVLESVKYGESVASLDIKEKHYNGLGVIQGGAIFTLADYSLAAAVLSVGQKALSITAEIKYFKAQKIGKLISKASVINESNKLITLAIDVKNEEGLYIAHMTSTVYKV